MGIDRSIASSAGQVFIISVGDMLVRLGIAVSLGEPEIDGMYKTGSFVEAN